MTRKTLDFLILETLEQARTAVNQRKGMLFF